MKQRETLKGEFAVDEKKETFEEYKKLRNKIKKILKTEEPEYYKTKFSNYALTMREVWRTVDTVLGSNRDMAPSKINVNGEIITNPKLMAEYFNHAFRNKIKKLKENSKKEVKIEPDVRLKNWIQRKQVETPEFKLKEISREALEKYIKKLK